MSNIFSKRFSLFLFLVFIILLSPCKSFAGEGSPYNRIVLFGDSLTDNGNLFWYALGFIPKSPPYYSGRFSNGNVWAELITNHFYEEKMITTNNYAVGGETAVWRSPLGGFLPYSLGMSINNYLLHTILRDRAKTLFIIWIGSNDYLPGAQNVDEYTTQVVNQIKASVANLIYHGGLNFILINLPDIAKSPYGSEHVNNSNFQQLTLLHNLKLAAAVEEIQNNFKNTNIRLFDANGLFEYFLKNREAENKRLHVNIKNTTNACLPGGYKIRHHLHEEYIAERINEYLNTKDKVFIFSKENTDINGLAKFIKGSPALSEAFIAAEEAKQGAQVCEKPDEYFFWDRVHPTTLVHKLLADKIIEFIDQNFKQQA